MTERLHHGRLNASVADLLDSGIELVPNFEMAAITVLDAAERPAEWPENRRRLRAEGIRYERHRGAILLAPGELDHVASVGFVAGNDEIYFCSEWKEEFEPFPGHVAGDTADFNVDTPLGLAEWMVDAGCLLAVGDGNGLNFATLDAELAARIRARFKPGR